MTPILVCLLCLAAGILWCIYTTICRLRAVIVAVVEFIAWLAIGGIGYLLVRLGWSAIVILFTNISVFGEILKGFWDSLGGFLGLIAIVFAIGLVGGIVAFVGSVIVVIAQYLFMAAMAVVGVAAMAVEFIEDKCKAGYTAALGQIIVRLEACQGDV